MWQFGAGTMNMKKFKIIEKYWDISGHILGVGVWSQFVSAWVEIEAQ